MKDFRINDTGINVGGDLLSFQKSLQRRHRFSRCFFQDFPYDRIITGGLPECFREALFIHIINNRPRIKDFAVSETIPVIPFLCLFQFFGSTIADQHFLYFFLCKTKIGAEAVIHDGVDLQIIHTAENTFFGDAKDPREKTVGKMRVIFKCTGKQVPDETDDFLIITGFMTLLNRCIVFVDDNDGSFPDMLMEHS